jgi:exopolysaccharide biosynthesis polyprenyl glycosylphosphotransferase
MLTKSQRNQIWSTAITPVIDYGAIMIGGLFAYYIRYILLVDSFQGVKQIYGLDYLIIFLFLSLIIVLILALMGQYKIFRPPTVRQSIINIFLSVFIVILGLISYLYFNEYNPNRLTFDNRGIVVSRFVIGTVGFSVILWIFLLRTFKFGFSRILLAFGLGKSDLIIIGKDNSLTSSQFERANVRRIQSFGELNSQTLEQIMELLDSREVGEVFVSGIDSNKQNISELLEEIAFKCQNLKVRLVFSPSLFNQLDVYKVYPINIEDKYYFEVGYTRLEGWRVVFKRGFDLLVSSLFVLIFSPVYLMIIILIKLDSRGSIFYSSERIGPDGKVFKMYKFRRFKEEYCTSELDPKAKEALKFEQELIKSQGESADRGALYKIKDDPRMTNFGKVLEQTSLDELPQFFNVLLGNLSLVGPRAHQPREVKKYARHHYKVLNIKPGITGLAQIKGRSDLHFENEVKFDTYYVENWSFWLDLKILFLTPIIIFFKKHKS